MFWVGPGGLGSHGRSRPRARPTGTLFIIVAWGVPAMGEQVVPQPVARRSLALAAVALFTHAIEVTTDSVLAQYNVSDACDARGDEAHRLFPDSAIARHDLAVARAGQAKPPPSAVSPSGSPGPR
jgi:hypothetical protein